MGQTASDVDFEVAGLALERGKRAQTRLPTVELADGTSITVPVMVVRGAEPGPLFYLGAAFHAD